MLGNNFTENFLTRLVLGVIISTLFVMIFSIIYREKFNHDYKLHEFKPVSQINRLTNISIDSSSYFSEGYRKHNSNLTKNKDLMINKNEGPWYYEQIALGLNYRLTDIAAALDP